MSLLESDLYLGKNSSLFRPDFKRIINDFLFKIFLYFISWISSKEITSLLEYWKNHINAKAHINPIPINK